MPLSQPDKKEIETIVRKEIKDFFKANTLSKFEDDLINLVKKEISNGKLRGDVNEIVTKIFTEFYYIMWNRRSMWEPSLKKLK